MLKVVRWGGGILLGTAAAVGSVVIFAQSPAPSSHPTIKDKPHHATAVRPAGTQHPPMSLAPGVPLSLTIPKLNVRAPVSGVGIDSDGEMAEPLTAEGVTWYRRGYLPGAIGNAVFAGHYTWLGEAGIFHDLTKLVSGDEIHIDNDQGSRLRFVVTANEHFLTDSAPGEVIFGKSKAAQIKLITCYGRWQHDMQQYQERYVVTATYVGESAAQQHSSARVE